MDGLKRRIRTTADFFDELQDEIDAINAASKQVATKAQIAAAATKAAVPKK